MQTAYMTAYVDLDFILENSAVPTPLNPNVAQTFSRARGDFSAFLPGGSLEHQRKTKGFVFCVFFGGGPLNSKINPWRERGAQSWAPPSRKIREGELGLNTGRAKEAILWILYDGFWVGP